jgi:hypothetical protein
MTDQRRASPAGSPDPSAAAEPRDQDEEIVDDAPPHDRAGADGGRTSRRAATPSGSAREIGRAAGDLRIVDGPGPERDAARSSGDGGDAEPSGLDESDELILTPEGLVTRRDDDDERGRGSRTLRVGATGPLKEVESLVSAGRWQQICDELGAPETMGSLPPALRLVYGIACKESAPPGAPTSDTDRMTIEAVAALLGVGPESPIALVVAKRALRSKRPWAKREAPRGPLAFLLLVLGLGFGGLVGWFLTFYM